MLNILRHKVVNLKRREVVNLDGISTNFSLSVPTALQDSISTIIKLVVDQPAINIQIIDPLFD